MRWTSDKAALRESIHGSSAGLKVIADHCGVSYAQVQKWGDEYEPDAYPSGRRVPLLIEACDNTSYIDYFEGRINRLAFRVPSADRPSAHQVAQMVTSFGTLLQKIADADADGQYSREEVIEVERQGEQVIAAIAGQLEFMRRSIVRTVQPREVVRFGGGRS